ncbi:MAG: DUF721 domain-containing protein [Alphaproteobacteria bacterium]|nr:DUF721 domain-containing protein [Rickettsiales bacterium]
MTKKYRISFYKASDVLTRMIGNSLKRRGLIDFQLLENWQNILNAINIDPNGSYPVKIANITKKGRVLYVRSINLGFKTSLTFKKAIIVEMVNKMLDSSKQIVDIKLTR